LCSRLSSRFFESCGRRNDHARGGAHWRLDGRAGRRNRCPQSDACGASSVGKATQMPFYGRAIRSGRAALHEPTDHPYSNRMAGVEDTSGNRWCLARHNGEAARERAPLQPRGDGARDELTAGESRFESDLTRAEQNNPAPEACCRFRSDEACNDKPCRFRDRECFRRCTRRHAFSGLGGSTGR